MSSAFVPEWLPGLLAAPYFSPCPLHTALHRSERNFFCISCGGSSVCSVCVQREHSGRDHSVLQIRKSSYHDAIRIADVSRFLDLSAIQVYVINGAKIVFLNGRPQARPVKGAPYHCETCQRTLLDSCRFCSIACKLTALPSDASLSIAAAEKAVGKKNHGEAAEYTVSYDESADTAPRFSGSSGRHRVKASPLGQAEASPGLPALLPGEHDDVSSGESEGFLRQKRRRAMDSDEVTSAFPCLEDMAPASPGLNASWRTHKRKGVPHRSPLA